MSDSRAPANVQRSLKRSRVLNVILLAVSLFLTVVVIGQSLNSTGESSETVVTSENPQISGMDSDTETQAEAATTFERRDPDDPLAIGELDAPVVLVNYTDPRCPFCAKFANDVQPELEAHYVDPGDVRIEFRVVAAFGEDSETTASAVIAAGLQDRGVEYLTELYHQHPGQGQPVHTADELQAIAEAAGVADLEQFETDRKSDAVRQQVQEETDQWRRLGLTSVPFFLVDDEGFAGARELEVFQEFLDAKLAER